MEIKHTGTILSNQNWDSFDFIKKWEEKEKAQCVPDRLTALLSIMR